MAIDESRARAERLVSELRADVERMRDALDHIANVCNGSRTNTRRLRWIAERCKGAIEDNENWRTADLPVVDPLVETLRGLLKLIYPICAAELTSLVGSYTTPDDQERLGTAELIEKINERDVHADCVVMLEFLKQARRNVPEININELRKGAKWIELT